MKMHHVHVDEGRVLVIAGGTHWGRGQGDQSKINMCKASHMEGHTENIGLSNVFLPQKRQIPLSAA